MGARKIHGELQNSGSWFRSGAWHDLRSIRRRADPGKRWLTFLRSHCEVIAAFDFFTVPTVTFQLLYCFFVIERERRRILHFNVTRHPTADWFIQQLREAVPEAGPYRYVLFSVSPLSTSMIGPTIAPALLAYRWKLFAHRIE